MPVSFLQLAVIVVVGYFVWRVMSPRYAVRIVMDRRGVKSHKGLPKAHEREVLQFLQKHVMADRKLTISAQRQSNGYLRLHFRGPIDPGSRQQIRNFFNTIM